MADLQRWIPSMVDGLTPRERKILFCAFKKPVSKGVGIAQFCRFVSEHSAYRDGEQSLVNAVLNMAKGNNNIYLLYLISQFGTGRMDGIKTRLSLITREIFHEADEPFLNYLKDNEQSVEPIWFIPIIPMVLVNGCEHIGTDCTSVVPRFNPKDIIANLKRLLKGEDVVPMNYWCKSFEVKEKKCPFIEEYNEMNQQLKEKVKVCTTYMHLVDSKGAIKKYDTPEQILEDFVHIRLEFYKKRKVAMLHELQNAVMQLHDKVRLIREVRDGTFDLRKKARQDIVDELKKKGFRPLPASIGGKTIPGTEYDYLFSMQIRHLFDDYVQRFLSEKDAKQAELHELTCTSPESLWLRDLDALEKQLDKQASDGDDDDDDDGDDDEDDDEDLEVY